MTDITAITVMIVDDHPFLIDGITLALRKRNIDVSCSSTQVDGAVDLYLEFNPDVVLCDISFGGPVNGFKILLDLLAAVPSAKVIIYSQHDQDEFIYDAYNNGAKAYLTKNSTVELIEAIQEVAAGKVYFTPSMSNRYALMTLATPGNAVNPLKSLDEHELETLRLICLGHTETEVAVLMAVHPKTVTNRKSSLKSKLGVNHQFELMRLAIKHKLIV